MTGDTVLLYRYCMMLNWNSGNKWSAQSFLSTPGIKIDKARACDVLIFGAEEIYLFIMYSVQGTVCL